MASTPAQQRTFLGHPIGLFVLFFTEMWERFSYYGMRALLVLYMVDFFKWTQEDASNIYKWYTSLVYLTPLLGGYLADRYVGNKWAIIIGSVLMAIGHFLMAFEEIWIFYCALGFLIMGNGFFKPNMSVQVGRLYPQNDPRRDGAYTIFYMGINLGAFLSPIVCGALKDTKALGFHWGFGAAGVGMVLGLIVYLLGLPFIKELPSDLVYEGDDARDSGHGVDSHIMTEEEAATTPSVIPSFATLAPKVFTLLGVALLLGSPILGWFEWVKWDNVIAMIIASGCAFIAGWILSHLSMAVRDRVLAIYALFIFVVFFWGAFEQAGNAMNVWADQTTNRYLTETPPQPSVYPDEFEAIADKGFGEVFKEAFSKPFGINPVLTTSFQSINAFAIVCFAPIFAWLWLFLGRRGKDLSIAAKMAIGVFLQGIAFALMIWSVQYEQQPSSTTLASLPPRIVAEADQSVYFHDAPDLGEDDAEGVKAFEQFAANDLAHVEKMIAHGGRMTYDPTTGALGMRGVLNANHRDRILRASAPADFVREIRDFALQTKKAKAAADEAKQEEFTVKYTLKSLPESFDPLYLRGFDPEDLTFDRETKTFVAHAGLADKDYKQIIVAASDPALRTALNDLYVQSAAFKVSSWWLFWFYILCTLGELCLSPVGLSMVSKLAPARFATMLMGMWLLTSFFGNFTAGLAGENWERLEPSSYFMYIAVAMSGAALVCYAIARKVTAMMHGVK
jgi:POT family proton-dependent oligopeptide transporter